MPTNKNNQRLVMHVNFTPPAAAAAAAGHSNFRPQHLLSPTGGKRTRQLFSQAWVIR